MFRAPTRRKGLGAPWAYTNGNGCAGPPPPERARTIQCLVCFISVVLHEAKTRYLEVHKRLSVVLIASRKLRHYFQAHRISVVNLIPSEGHPPHP
jgi:hypothetical protein